VAQESLLRFVWGLGGDQWPDLSGSLSRPVVVVVVWLGGLGEVVQAAQVVGEGGEVEFGVAGVESAEEEVA
jgi:hypothetical protein